MKKKTIKQLEKDLKKVLYPLIKQRDGNICITCKKQITNKSDWHCGHFAKAELCNLVYRYNIYNLNTQCSYCNKWLAGNTIEYEKQMVAKWGQAITDDIKENYKKPLENSFNSRIYLNELIIYYKETKKL